MGTSGKRPHVLGLLTGTTCIASSFSKERESERENERKRETERGRLAILGRNGESRVPD
jgi:hypothetical protein